MAFTEIEEKEIILKWIYDLYNRLGDMTLKQIYAYLLGQTKETIVQDLDNLLGQEDNTKAEKESEIEVFRKNIKKLQKKIKKL